ncbi:MerR family transcriptional regulator [Planomicrobium sp. YIM 101495]|uniref:MerR family transcriptional regulator n=1 Tax=Planomicrobium sp. YIM 101495 TaxID=2665160 RepID=UPI0012BA13C3|nr:MerR family transcriptional regulator [Planomicrobium sp. YIM 101495]MTD31105.1 MerR family transcriptional regulator [Planomicrobium sp. YIM 101495]
MYNIKAVSKLLDMPKVTIRSWETRYNAITPARTEAGHRLYSEQNIEDLQWLKIQVQQNGMKISEAVRLLHASKQTAQQIQEESKVVFDSEPYSRQLRELMAAAAEMDTERFNYLLDLNFSLFHHQSVFFNILAPFMVQVGEEWENGNFTVAHEHLVTSIIHQRFMQFFRLFPVKEDLPKVMAFCPSGEHHELGLLMFTLFLRENGYGVLYFGVDTPLDGLPQVIGSQEIEVVAMSYSSKERRKVTEEYMKTLASQCPDLQFIIGGNGADSFSNPGPDPQRWGEWLVKWQQAVKKV